MRTTIKLLTVAGFAGLSLAACGASKSAAVSGTGNATSAGSTTTVPANAPVGFNAAKTEFVLPHHLGLLPASELALAKADPTYAAGLANQSDWHQISVAVAPPSGTTNVPNAAKVWVYTGASSSSIRSSAQASAVGLQEAAISGIKDAAMAWNDRVISHYGTSSITVLHSTTVPVVSNTLNILFGGSSSSTPYYRQPVTGYQFITPSTLEIQAAPAGTLVATGSPLPAICVPIPEAIIANKKPINTHLPVMTAGPSTIFAAKGMVSNSPTPPKSSPLFYDKGVASCAAFH